MIVTGILFFSAVLFIYWLKRIEMLLRHPGEQARVLTNDLTRSRDLWNYVRSMFLPALAN
jgi:hypothetical protein